MTIPFLPLFAKQLGAGFGVIGTVIAMRGFGAMGTDVPGGMLISRLGKRPAMIAASFGISVISLLIGLTNNIALLAALTVLNGSMQMLWMISVQTHIRHVVVQKRRGRALSIIGGLTRIGALAGPILAGFFATSFSIRAVYFFQACIFFLSFVICVMGSSRLQEQERSIIPREAQGLAKGTLSLRTLVRDYWRPMIGLNLVMVSLQGLRYSRDIILPLWADHIGLKVSEIGLAAGIPIFLELLLFIPGGIIMDRLGRKWALVPCLILLSGGMALIPITHTFAALLAVNIIASAGNGLGSGLLLTLGTDMAPREATATFLGICHTLSDFGAVGGPLLIGVVAQLVALNFSPLIVAAGGAATLFVALRLPETLQRLQLHQDRDK